MAEWESHYWALLQYIQEYGHCKVPRDLVYSCLIPKVLFGDSSLPPADERDGFEQYCGRLGRWLVAQRKAQKNGVLRADREAKLQKLVDDGNRCGGLIACALTLLHSTSNLCD